MKSLPGKALLSALLGVFCALSASAGGKLDGGTLAIPRSAATGGGTLLASAGFGLANAVGETSVSTFSGGGFRLQTGLVPLVPQPGSVTALAVVTKSTGTLELSWTAPGIDGLLGDVVAGVWRVDYSSEPAHAFDPTVFKLEIPTACAAGSPQGLVLTGLEANTTYFARVYLGDVRKALAETSDQEDSSTWADTPASPVLSAVYATSITITWALPASGAEGYRLHASSTDFGAALPGGTLYSTSTPGGTAVTLTVRNLVPATTYYFRLGSLNWQDDFNFTTLLATRTRGSGGVMPVSNLVASADPWAHRVALTWDDPVFADFAGVLVLMSTNPITDAPADGAGYPAGAVLAGGALSRSSAAFSAHAEGGLALDATQYFQLFARSNGETYSVGVGTAVVLDLPPLTAAGLGLELLGPVSARVRWSPVLSSDDGSSFRSAPPDGWELLRYDVYRATGIVRAGWTLVGSTNAAAEHLDVALPLADTPYFFKVVPVDGYSGPNGYAMAVDTRGDLYAVAPDGVSRLRVPADIAASLVAGGKPVLVRADEQPGDLGGRVVKSVRFDAFTTPAKTSLPNFRLPETRTEVSLRYEVAGGVVVPSAAGALALPTPGPAVSAQDATSRLGAYWDDGRDFVKLYGSVDPAEQTVRVLSSMPGGYQVRTIVRDAAFSFDVSNITNKALTPNGDGLNDTVVFVFDNPRDSGYEGKVFDMRGAFVSEMRSGPVANSLLWDGRAGGRVVDGGVYVYQIRAEGKVFNGTVVVIR
ncbi:MAG: fibronectin type III domain-containing protein [Elusimicrobiota bacterium]|jgi:hypothetical protein